MTTVAKVDLQRYLGTWYEIYRLPNRFEDADCNTVTAKYSLNDDADIQVLNTCHKPGGSNEAKGLAKIVDPKSNAKLKVSFFRPFYGDYWILDLAPDYSWVLIGEGSGKYFWILARKSKLSDSDEQMLLEKAAQMGYMTERFIKPKNTLRLN